jgi:xanthine permease XanP
MAMAAGRRQHCEAMATRPSELIYAVDERPPWPKLVALGLQHTLLICVYLVLVSIVAKDAAASHDVTLNAISLGMIGLAIGAVLQAQRAGPIGSGYLAVPVFSAIYLGPSVLAAKAGGLPAVFGMTVFAGAVEIILSRFLHRLRPVFPPAVSGFVVCIVGIELGLVGMDHTLAVEEYGHPDFAGHMAAAVLTLSVSIGLSIWGRGALRLVCSLIGLASGLTAAFLLGLVSAPALRALESASWLSLPHLEGLSYSFDPLLAPAFLAAGVAATLRTIGVVTTCQRINDADWKRPDMRTIEGGVLADGLGCAIGGLLGAPGMSTGPSLVGVSNATGATSRYIALACGAILIAMALVPKFAALFLMIPLSVIGGMLVFTGALMIAGGIQVMVSRSIDTRMTYVIGISFLLGLSRLVYPDYFDELPPYLQSLTGSTLALGIASAIGLTLLFRLGLRRREALPLETAGDPSADLAGFLRKEGKAWKIDPDVIDRAVSSTTHAVSHLQEAHLISKPVGLSASYDGTDLRVELQYEGRSPSLPDLKMPTGHLAEEESSSHGLASFLSGVYADRVDSSTKGSLASLRLYFAA